MSLSQTVGFPPGYSAFLPSTESTQTQTSVPINKVKIKLCLMFILFILPCFLVYRIHNGLSEMLEMTLVSLEEFHWIWQILNNYSSNSCNETLNSAPIRNQSTCIMRQTSAHTYRYNEQSIHCKKYLHNVVAKIQVKKKVQVIPVHLRLHW